MNFLSFVSNLLLYSPDKFDGTNVSYDLYLGVNIAFMVLMGLAALAAIVLVMLTPGNSQGIDALGGSSETFYGKNKGKSTESKLKLATVICLAILAVFSVVSFILQNGAIWGLA